MMMVGRVRKLCWPDGTPVRGTVKAGKPKAPPGKVGIDELNGGRVARGADPIDPEKVNKTPTVVRKTSAPPRLATPTPPPRGAAPAPTKVILVCEDGADPTFAIFTSADLLKEIQADLAAIRKALEAPKGDPGVATK